MKRKNIHNSIYSYTYNDEGIRVAKYGNGKAHKYYVDGDRILGENITSGEKTDKLKYYYDQMGVCGFRYNNAEYYYQKNAQGDIKYILDNSGSIVVKYEYDVWGKCKVLNANGTINTSSAFIGNINPYRYRGYYYDSETGLYYLNSRYYDAEVGRFISQDSIEYLDAETLGGLNLYAYCGNNPVINIDPDGHAFISILIAMGIGVLIGGVVGGVFEIGKQIYSNGWDPSDWNWQQIGLSAFGGAVAGMISAIPIGGWVGAFAFGGLGSVAGGLITGSVNNWETALLAFGIGAIANVAAYGISNKFANIKAGKIFDQGNKAKSLAVQKLQGHTLNLGSKALKGSLRNAFKQTSQKEIQKLLMNASTRFRYGVYSAIFSSTMSGWY